MVIRIQQREQQQVLNLSPADLSSLLNLSGTTHTAAGDYPADAWTFAGDFNYNADAGTVHDIISAAGSTITVTGSNSFIYNGQPQGPNTSTHTGSTGAITFSYSGTENSSSLYAASATAPTNAGNYSVTATLAADANFSGATSAPFAFTIGKANAIINVTPYTVTFDGNPHTATGTATGVEPSPADLSSLLDLSGTTHTAAGDYPADAWTFAGDFNYNADAGTVHDIINTAGSTITVTGSNSFIYNGQPQGPNTSTHTGSTGAITFSYSRNSKFRCILWSKCNSTDQCR